MQNAKTSILCCFILSEIGERRHFEIDSTELLNIYNRELYEFEMYKYIAKNKKRKKKSNSSKKTKQMRKKRATDNVCTNDFTVQHLQVLRCLHNYLVR